MVNSGSLLMSHFSCCQQNLQLIIIKQPLGFTFAYVKHASLCSYNGREKALPD